VNGARCFSGEREFPEQGEELWERIPEAFEDVENPIIQSHNVNIQYCSGMTFDGELIWGADGMQNRLAGMNKVTFEMENEIELNFSPSGLTFVDGVLWCGNARTNNLHAFDLDGNELDVVETDLAVIGLAYDGNGHLLVNSRTDSRIHVFNIENSEEIALMNQLPGFEQDNSWDIEWVEEHNFGQLWGIGEHGVHQAYVDENWFNIYANQFLANRQFCPKDSDDVQIRYIYGSIPKIISVSLSKQGQNQNLKVS
jgi:hypothetical protein